LLEDPAGLAFIEDDTVLVRIASLSEDPELIEAAIGRVRASEVRLDVAGNHPVARVRLFAAQGIEEISMLQQLARKAKHKDKAVYLHCKELLEKHHAAEREEADRQARIRQLSEDALALSLAVDSPDFKSEFRTLDHRWQSLKAGAGDEQHEQIQNALDVCAARIENKEAKLASEEEQQARIKNAEEAYPQLIAELEELESATAPLQDTAAIRELNTTLDGIEDRWLAAMQYAKASSQQTKAFKIQLNLWRAIVQTSQRLRARQSQLKKILGESEQVDKSDFLALRRLLQQAEKLDAALPWPESQGSVMPPQLHELQESLARLRNQLEALRKREKQILEQLQPSLDALRMHIEEMQVEQADDGLKKIRHNLRQLRPKQQHKFEQELKLLAGRLGEIHDWQGFAIEPKKIDLIERMQALVGSEEDPEILAGKIKTLQSKWKKLGALPPRRDRALWNQFSAAADEAWEPCKLAFARQAESRKKNYQLRMQLVTQLVDYERKMVWPDDEDPESGTDGPDWKLVQKTLDTAREAFRNIRPVDRKDERRSQKALRAVSDKIFSHIKVEYERNIALKKALVDRAQAIAGLEDLNQAIERAKKIQREWKYIGITPVGVDRRLWKDFRAACDAVFARLDKQREDHRQALGEQIEQAENLARQARALLDSEDDGKRLHLKRDLSGLQAEFRKLELPRTVQQKIGKQFSAMEREARDVVAKIRKRQEQQRWQCLVDRMQACALKAADKKKAGGPWQEEGEVPKGVDADALKEFWQQGPGKTAGKELLDACIALEILIGVESPPEDKEARMAYQMQRLVEGMGQQQEDSEKRLLELINEFIKMHPGDKWLQRFCRGIKTARAPS
jgi:hypothetical protein